MRRRRHARFAITDPTISKVTTGLNSIEIERNPLCYWEFNYVNYGDEVGCTEGLSNLDKTGIANPRSRRDSLYSASQSLKKYRKAA